MAIRDFKTVFSDYNRGPVSFIHMLSTPIAAVRDTALLQEDIEQLKEAITRSEKNTSTKLAFYGSHHLDKVMQLNHIAYRTKQSVCFVDCQRLVDKYIGETEKHLSKLIAQAESENWILFFDEADALFGRRTKVNETHDQYANQEVSYLFKRLTQYSGLSILSLSEKSKLENVRYIIDSVITFR